MQLPRRFADFTVPPEHSGACAALPLGALGLVFLAAEGTQCTLHQLYSLCVFFSWCMGQRAVCSRLFNRNPQCCFCDNYLK